MLTINIKCSSQAQAATTAFRMRSYLYGSVSDGSKVVRARNTAATVTLPEDDERTVIVTIGNDPDNMTLFVNRIGEATR